jgi:predicted enzyme related to lactoylglutathione lyase
MKLRTALIVAALLGGVTACTTTGQANLSGMSFSERPLTGKVIWNDLITEDLGTARQFYGGLFGWTFESMPGRGSEYVVARDGSSYVAGMLEVDARPDGKKLTRWLPYMSVENVDAAVRRSVVGGMSVLDASPQSSTPKAQ